MIMQNAERASEDKLIVLEALLPKLRPALEQKRLGIALKKAEEALRPFESQKRQIEALTDAASLLQDYIELNRRDLEDIADEIEEIAAEMKDADSRHELDGIAASFPNIAQKYIPRYNRAVIAMLSRYIAQELTSLGTLGRLLVKIGANEIGERCKALEDDARQLERRSPSELAVGLRVLRANKASTEAELTALAKEPEVDAFLTALSRGETTLTLVTPTVLKWLDSLNARDQFRVIGA